MSDGAYLAGTDEYLNILSGDKTMREDGTMIGVKELELPEKLKNETSIAIEFVLYRATEYDFFDGKRWCSAWKTGRNSAYGLTCRSMRTRRQRAIMRKGRSRRTALRWM